MSGDEFERIRPEIAALVKRGNITSAETKEIRCNSWEWEAMIPALDDEAFVERMQYALDNCFTRRERPYTTYNQAIEGLYAPELLRRYKVLTEPPKGVSIDEAISRSDAIHETLDQACELSDAFLQIYPHGIPEHEMDGFWSAVYRIEALTCARRAIKKLS